MLDEHMVLARMRVGFAHTRLQSLVLQIVMLQAELAEFSGERSHKLDRTIRDLQVAITRINSAADRLNSLGTHELNILHTHD